MNNKKELIKYIYENKNGLKSDFLTKFSENEFEGAYLTNLISRHVRSTKEESWRITSEGYDFYFMVNPEKTYMETHFIDKIIDYINYLVYFKQKIREQNKRNELKRNYFKELGEKNGMEIN